MARKRNIATVGLHKKDLGAFYTPHEYADMAADMVLNTVNNILEREYVIIDRCAGTGNLETALIGKYDKNGTELISRCIVSTLEYYEYKVLNERLGDKVLEIIPPTEADVKYSNGMVSNADALSKDFIENPIVQEYLEDDNCSIILLENPPFRDISSNSAGRAKQQNSYVLDEMKKEIKGATLNDLSNRFIWSGFKYYLRNEFDYYLIFSPIKYYKTCHLCNKKFVGGYLFNRKHFHASSPSAITCIMWQNIDESPEEIKLKAYDIKDNKCEYVCDRTIKKGYNLFSQSLYDKRKFNDDEINGICCETSGYERTNNKSIKVKKLFNDNIVGYIRASSFNFDANSKSLLRCAEHDGHGFFLRKDNYLEKLPLWVAKQIPLDNWYDKEIYATTADKGSDYTKDKEFLKMCLLYVNLSNQNKCLSLYGSDKRYYKNELCLDSGTQSSRDINNFSFDIEENTLLELWKTILRQAKNTKSYNKDFSYGIYQIGSELNTYTTKKEGMNEIKIYDYPQLNGDLATLRNCLKDYYNSHIKDKMFEYELVK